MTELAPLPLLTVALLVEYAHHGLRVHPKGHFLHLYRLEQLGHLPLRLFACGLFLFSGFLFSGGFLLLRSLGLGCLGLDEGDLFLGLCTFFLWGTISQGTSLLP